MSELNAMVKRKLVFYFNFPNKGCPFKMVHQSKTPYPRYATVGISAEEAPNYAVNRFPPEIEWCYA